VRTFPDLFLAVCLLVTFVFRGTAAPLEIRVSENHRFLTYSDGKPFFYLGDTAWELFHRLNREEADFYLKDRAKRGFTVIQAVGIAELDGQIEPNAYGHLPLADMDPARPDVKPGSNDDYWDNVDYIVNKAESLGLTMGFLPTWGRFWHDKVRNGKPLFTEENAAIYGEWLGNRYKSNAIIWILGGDRAVENKEQKAVILAMARGLRKGDEGAHLITFHPSGGGGSAGYFQEDEVIDFNLRQNGHSAEFTGRYDQTRVDYDRKPLKPVIDGEPLYEGHPISFNAKSFGHSVAADVRRALYWDLFSGACGHTYGHHSIWQMWDGKRKPINNPLMTWREALEEPGGSQMHFARQLIESRPILSRVPDDDLIVKDLVPTSVPGAGRARFVGTRDLNGSYAFIYVPVGKAFKASLSNLSGKEVRAWWFNPRDGQAALIGVFQKTESREFIPPVLGELLDWVLVLDDASKEFGIPAKKS
jgi:hypothetical protein